MSRFRLTALLLALLTLILYLPAVRYDYLTYDDGDYVTDNSMVQNGLTLDGIKWAFTTMHASNWFPLTWLSHMLDCSLFGQSPTGPHLTNILLHTANTALLLLLLVRLTGRLWPSAFIAALFGWHPVHIESVAWISERKDVLSTFFALIAMLNYERYVAEIKNQNPRAKIYFRWSLIAFALGLMAKPMVVTVPCLMLLLDFWPLRRTDDLKLSRINRALVFEKWPFLFITMADSLITFLAQSQQGGNAVVSLTAVPLHYRLENVPISYVSYLAKIFWPTNLAIFYPLQKIIPSAALAPTLLLLMVSLAAFWWHRTRPYLLTGWFWFLGMLVPVIGLVQVGGAQIADRYSYLSAVGIFIIVTFGGCDLAARCKISRSMLAGISIFILTACVITMENQLRYWQNSVTLFQHALAVTPDNDVARDDLGVGLERQGRLAEAAEQYRAAARLEPDRYQGHHNLASALDRLGRPAEALAEHREAVRISPETQFLHHSLGLSLNTAGQTDEAIKEFSQAAQLDANYPWPHIELAKIYLCQNRTTNALDELRATLRIAPDNIEILTFTAHVLASSENPNLRDGQNAFLLAAKANLLANGRRPATLDVLGMACAELGKFDDAQMAAQTALATADALQLKNLEPIRARLALYKNHQPWRESFGATNAPTARP